MDFNKSLLLIVSLSSLFLSGLAIRLPGLAIGLPSTSPSMAPIPPKHINNPIEALLVATDKIFEPEPKVVEFCTGTENPALCASTISPFVRGSFDPISALETEIDATLNQSLKIVHSIEAKLSDPTTIKASISVLDVCQKNYDNMVDTIKEALQLLQQQNVVDAYYKFNSVLSDRSSCEDAFTETPGVNNPFADDSKTVYQLGGNCMAIMDGLVNKHSQFMI